MSCVLRIDVGGSVRCGSRSDILLIGMDFLKHAESCRRRIYIFIATGLEILFLSSVLIVCEFPFVHN